MKILRKHSTILKYSIDLQFLETHSQFKPHQYTSSNWRLIDGCNYLQYDVIFQVKDILSDDYFINFHNRLDLECIIENVEVDAKEVVKYKEMVNVASQLFLMNNTQDFYDLLDFREMNYKNYVNPHENLSRESSIEYEITQISRSLSPTVF